MGFASDVAHAWARRRCSHKGHLFVDSRSQPGTQVCVRCRLRKPFEGLEHAPSPQVGPETI